MPHSMRGAGHVEPHFRMRDSPSAGGFPDQRLSAAGRIALQLAPPTKALPEIRVEESLPAVTGVAP